MPKKRTSRSFKVGRDAVTGQFIPVKVAKRRPRTTVVETIPNPKRRSKVRSKT